MIACPGCKRRVFTRRDILYASLDGTAQCRVCGRTSRLDILSRWMISCVLALVLPIVLLHGQVFYSGHLFLVSIAVILGGWRIISYCALPVLALEIADAPAIDRRQSLWILAVLLAAAMIFDGFMASRFEYEEALENQRAPSAAQRER